MISPSTPIRKLIQEHYGMCLPITVMRLDDELQCCSCDYKRVLRDWTALMPMIDLVVWDEQSYSYRLVQDVCFRDAYTNEADWHKAILDLITNNPLVWVVKHLD